MCKEQGKKARKGTREGAGAGSGAGARTGAGFLFNEMSDHLAVLKPQLMIDIIIWSLQDICKE